MASTPRAIASASAGTLRSSRSDNSLLSGTLLKSASIEAHLVLESTIGDALNKKLHRSVVVIKNLEQIENAHQAQGLHGEFRGLRELEVPTFCLITAR
jgi:hypothetical protein